VITCYKFRIYPKRSQVTAFKRLLDLHRELYNAALEERREAWKGQSVSVHYLDQANQLTEIRGIRSDLADLNFSSCQQTLRRVDKSFANFFRRVKEGAAKAGYPRFKSKDRFNTVEFVYGDGCKVKGDSVYFQQVGQVRILLHREIQGTIKRCAFTRRGDKWFLGVTCEKEAALPANSPTAEVGIDVGLQFFATLSTGEKIPNPRFLRRDEQDLQRAQRKLSQARRGSSERQHARKVVSRIHERIANRRSNFAHQESHQLADRFGFIVFEDLRIQNMQANHCLAQSISDTAWNQFVTYTTYKAAKAGGRVATVDPRHTSQVCSACGAVVKKDLSVRVHVCPDCGLTLDRDTNAAINILTRGRASLGLSAKEAVPL
jgi:putative transposase